MDISSVVEVNNLRVQFPSDKKIIKAVDGINFKINRSETVALVGESGSGKSVSAMSIMRLNDMSGGIMPTGSINLRLKNNTHLNIVEASPQELSKIRGNEVSMIFQEPMTCLNPVLTIGLQIKEAIMLHQSVNEKDSLNLTIEALNQVRIPDAEKIVNNYPHHLSGGMRQRVMIAMALSCRPQLLIADEPSTALDVTIQAQIINLIKILQEEIGMAVLFITHDMGVVAEVADRVIVMFNGEIVEEGEVDKIFHNPLHQYTKKLINSVPRLGSMEGKNIPEKFTEIGLD